MMMQSAQRIASTMDSQIGENPGQNQKATTTLAVQEEGKKIFSGIYKRCHRSLKKEIKRHYYLNSVYLSAESYLNVLDGLKPEEKQQIGDKIFKKDFDLSSTDVIPAADSNYSSQQEKMMKANALLQKIPTGLVNPQVAMQRALEAEEQSSIEQIMDVPQQPPPFEQVKLDAEMKLSYAKLMLDTLDKESEWLNKEIATTSLAILNIAKAEGEEEGMQANEYNQQLQQLEAMAKINIENRKEANMKAQQAGGQVANNNQAPTAQPGRA